MFLQFSDVNVYFVNRSLYESKLKKTKSEKKEGEFINVNVNRVVLKYECINIQTNC